MNYHRVIVSILFSLTTMLSVRASWDSFIINFPTAGSQRLGQTWEIDADDSGYTFIANQEGAFLYDGQQWTPYSLENGRDVRSIRAFHPSGRVWAGGIQELGYFELKENGLLRYVSLMDSLSASSLSYPGNVWGIYEHGDAVYFHTDIGMLVYRQEKFEKMPLSPNIEFSTMVEGVVYAANPRGLHVLMGNTFFTFHGTDEIVGHRIRGVVPQGRGLLVVTAFDGIYYCDGMTAVPYPTEADSFMKANEVFCATSRGGQIALGTVRGGVAVINADGSNPRYFNDENGLHNNTVLAVDFDYRGNLWAGLDRGVAYIDLSSAMSHLSGINKTMGSGYAAALHNGYLYLGTNRGLYAMPYSTTMGHQRRQPQIVGHSGQVWSLAEIDGELYSVGDHGIYHVHGLNTHRITDLEGVWGVQKVRGEDNLLWAGTYSGLWLLERTGVEDWIVRHKVDRLDDSMGNFVQTGGGQGDGPLVVWCSSYDKVAKLVLSPELDRVDHRSFFDLPAGTEPYLTLHDDQLYVTSDKGMLRYDEAANSLVAAYDIDSILMGHTAYNVISQRDNTLAAMNSRSVCAFTEDSLTSRKTIIDFGAANIQPVTGFESLVVVNDSTLILPNDDGFALIEINRWRATALDNKKLVRLSSVKSMDTDSVLFQANFLGYQPELSLDAYTNSLKIEWASIIPGMGRGLSYQWRINDGPWMPTHSTSRELIGLSPGQYTFEVRAAYDDAHTDTASISFKIAAPWYRTIWAYLAYLCMIVGALYLLYKWERRRMLQQEERALADKNREILSLEKDLQQEKTRHEEELVKLEKERLENELKHKSQEMANVMIDVARKNEMLTSIKRDITKVMDGMKGPEQRDIRRALVAINNGIDSNIDNDDSLKRIEREFDLIHNNFMQRLQQEYPQLTINERMMCAYLKMNLSSKEIAPLFNISVRGVETIRYRVRKKFDLQREQSLTEFINNL